MSTDNLAGSFEGMMDAISEVPLVLEESKRSLASIDNIFSTREAILLESLLCTLEILDTWQQSCVSRSSRPPYWAVSSKLHNPSDDTFGNTLFPFALEFESLDST